MSVSGRLSCLKLQRQAKVGDAGAQVVLQQHILTFDVPEKAKTRKNSQLRRNRRDFESTTSAAAWWTCERWRVCVRPCVQGCLRGGKLVRGLLFER